MAEKLPPWTEFSAALQDQIFGAGIDLQVTQVQLICAAAGLALLSLQLLSAMWALCKRADEISLQVWLRAGLHIQTYVKHIRTCLSRWACMSKPARQTE